MRVNDGESPSRSQTQTPLPYQLPASLGRHGEEEEEDSDDGHDRRRHTCAGEVRGTPAPLASNWLKR